jgi:hypothetical protein
MSTSRGNAVLAGLGAAVALVATARPVRAQDAAPTRPGVVIYRDPVTGRLGAPPADVAAQLGSRATRWPMVERAGTTAGGGVLLDGVPPMAVTATVDAQGRVSTRCQPDGTR